MRVGLIPLDERPVNTRYPAMIADIAGIELIQPPLEILSKHRTPADAAALQAWLSAQAAGLDALIVSLEMFGYGGLIASRTSEESAADVVKRLEILRAIKHQHPTLSIYGFDLIMRISQADDAFEEPHYWAEYGSRLYRYSQLLDQQHQGQAVADELSALKAQLPGEYVQDFLLRRLRNHTANLNALEMTASGVFDLLVLSSDDTSKFGLGTREKRWLTEWADQLLSDSARLLMYPGADEVGCVLLARAINQQWKMQPRFALHYAIPGDEDITAPFEDGPVRITVERQIHATGSEIVATIAEADLILAVNTPSRGHPRHYAAYDPEEDHQRRPALVTFARQIQSWIDADKPVVLADVAYPNGSDPVLVELLRAHVQIERLAAYGAWNTAGNTIGTALAQGIAAASANHLAQQLAQQRFLTHRFLEDWGYQFAVRAEVRNRYAQQYGTHEIAPEHRDQVRAEIESGLRTRLAQLPGLGQQWSLVPGSVRLPWDRFFEVDFDLTPVPEG